MNDFHMGKKIIECPFSGMLEVIWFFKNLCLSLSLTRIFYSSVEMEINLEKTNGNADSSCPQ